MSMMEFLSDSCLSFCVRARMIVTTDGESYCGNLWSQVDDYCFCAHEGTFLDDSRRQCDNKQGKVGLRDDSGNVLIPAVYDNLGWSNGEDHVVNDRIGFYENGAWGLLSLENKRISTPSYTILYPSDAYFVAAKRGKVSKKRILSVLAILGRFSLPAGQIPRDHICNDIFLSRVKKLRRA